jgi:hypothetical protein
MLEKFPNSTVPGNIQTLKVVDYSRQLVVIKFLLVLICPKIERTLLIG